MEKCESQRERGALLSVTVDGNGYRIHTLIDDTERTLRASRLPVRRDPMVEALFGPAVPVRAKKRR